MPATGTKYRPGSCFHFHNLLLPGLLILIYLFTDAPEEPIIIPNSEHTEITCTSEGNPQPSIMWTMPDGQRISGQATVSIIQPPGTMNDTYTCTASNGVEPKGIKNITYGQLINMPLARK